jgi:hypothetical protein
MAAHFNTQSGAQDYARKPQENLRVWKYVNVRPDMGGRDLVASASHRHCCRRCPPQRWANPQRGRARPRTSEMSDGGKRGSAGIRGIRALHEGVDARGNAEGASNHRLGKRIFPADGWADLWHDLDRAGAGTQ